jgi:hypothetical protein
MRQAEAACDLNSGFTQAQAMLGIANVHLGELESGKSLIEDATRANKDDPHRFRHQPELAIAGFYAEAKRVAQRLVEQAPKRPLNCAKSAPCADHRVRAPKLTARWRIQLTSTKAQAVHTLAPFAKKAAPI